MTLAADTGLVHATCVAIQNQGVLLIGPSGSGKSTLALELMALGASLVADDRVILKPSETGVSARAPDALAGKIEARGIGILAAAARPSADVRLVIDMGREEAERIPPERMTDLMGARLPMLHKVAHRGFAPSIMQYMLGGRCE